MARHFQLRGGGLKNQKGKWSDGINKYRKARKGNTWEHLRRRKKGYLQGRAKYFIKRASILHKRAQGRGQRALTSIERHKREILGDIFKGEKKDICKGGQDIS